MEASRKLSITLFFSLILLSSLFRVNEARLLNDPVESAIEKILGELYVEAMKTGGPSHGGEGNGLALGGIKRSGPSPGEGN